METPNLYYCKNYMHYRIKNNIELEKNVYKIWYNIKYLQQSPNEKYTSSYGS